MSTTTSTTISTTTQPPIFPVAVATFLGTMVFVALGTILSGESGEHGWGELAIVGGIALVVLAAVMALVWRLQDSPRAGAVGLTLSVIGLASVLIFFMGVTPAFAVGGMLLGAAARRPGRGAGLGIAATAVGALALVGYVAIYITDLFM